MKADFHSIYGTDVTPYPCETEVVTRHGSLGQDNIYVSLCQFIECKASSTGGAIYVSSTNYTKILIEQSSFSKCQVTYGYNGGAIYIGSQGNCVLYGVCGYACCTTSVFSYQFCFVQCTSSVDYIMLMRQLFHVPTMRKVKL